MLWIKFSLVTELRRALDLNTNVITPRFKLRNWIWKSIHIPWLNSFAVFYFSLHVIFNQGVRCKVLSDFTGIVADKQFLVVVKSVSDVKLVLVNACVIMKKIS